MTQTRQIPNIQDLLFKSGIITQNQLARAMATSARTGESISNILIHDKIVSEETMRTAVLTHGLIHENLISVELATDVIFKSVVEEINLEEAFRRMGVTPDFHLVTARLSQILRESGVVGEAELDTSIEASYSSGLPLGRVLVIRNVIPEAVAYAALSAHMYLKEGKITAQQAIEGLKLSAQRHISMDHALKELTFMPRARMEPLRLGELLVAADLVSEIDLLSAVEKRLGEDLPIGQILLRHNLISNSLLQKALKLQDMVNNHGKNPSEILAILKEASENDQDDIGVETSEVMPISFEDQASTHPHLPGNHYALNKSEDWMRTVQELTLEKQNLAFKVVNQQEEMKYRLARELHDTVIADLMMLKRYLGGDKKLSQEEIVEIVDHVIMQLRDICSDFAPRNFKEWGLVMCLRDVLERMSQRTGINTSFSCEFTLPELPDPVALHIYRIIQEGLNNIEKYSGATSVHVVIEKPREKVLRFILMDNGRGFDVGEEKAEEDERSADFGGMGLGGMQERADLIRCFYNTTFNLVSEPGKGSIITLEIELF